MDIGLIAALYAAALFLAGFAVAIALLARARRCLAESRTDAANLRNELENARIVADQNVRHMQSVIDLKDNAHSRELESVLRQCEQRLNDKDAFVAKSIETLRVQFASLAAEKLADRSKDLTRANSEQLEKALKPLREQVDSLRDLASRSQAQGDSLEKSFREEVERIGDVARSLSKTSDALRGNIRVQGRMGEDILAEKLRQAGLEENVTFFLQEGVGDVRPDAQVRDPQERRLVIDSKVNLTDYFSYANETDAVKRDALLKRHVAAMRRQIDMLVAKDYPRRLSEFFPDRNYLGTTAMFVPYEAPLAVAIERDPALLQYALERNVAIVTPLTLLAYLRLIYLAWQHEKERKNQLEMAGVARELLYRVNKFLSVFEALGARIDDVGRQYDEARAVFIDGHNAHSIAKSAQKLIGLGVSLESPKKGVEKPVAAKCLGEVADVGPDGEPEPQSR